MNRIGAYKYDPKPIGKGKYARVYKGYHIKSKKPVAIKKYKVLKNGQKEINIVKRIKNRSYFVRLRHFYIRRGRAHMVTDWFAGEPLGIRKETRWIGKKLPVEQSCRIVLKLLRAMRHMHAKNIQYRDVNPSNIMIKGSKIKIVDFGSSTVGQKKYAQLDLYLAGYVLYFLLKGNIRAYRARFPLIKPKGIRNKKLRAILKKAMHRNPKYRYKNANDFIKALAPLAKKRRR